jgi:hypothetical protein
MFGSLSFGCTRRNAMQKHALRVPFLAVMVVCLADRAVTLHAADASPGVQKTFDKLLAAVKANDRDMFLGDATDAVKQGTTPQIMEMLNKRLGSRLQKGYTATYLCQLKQAGHQVHLWKLNFKDGGDDVVVRVSLKDGKVDGFFLQ